MKKKLGVQNIFGYTEVDIRENHRRSLPSMPKSSLSRPKSKAILSRYQSRPESTTTTRSVHELVSKISTYLDDKTPSTTFKNLEPQIRALENVINGKKKEYNSLFNSNNQHQKFIESLENELAQKNKEMESLRDSNKVLSSKLEEADEILKGLENEKYYQEVLLQMAHNRKESSQSLAKPIVSLKYKLKFASHKREEAARANKRLHNEIAGLRNQYKKLNKSSIRKTYTHNFKASISTLNDIDSALNVMKTEHKINNDKHRLQQNLALANTLEPMILALEEEEEELETQMRMENNYKSHKNKFKDLKEATNITSIDEAEAYHKYLKDTESLLSLEAKDSENKEKTLKEELFRITEEVEKSKKKLSEKESVDTRVYNDLENELKNRNRDIRENEDILEKLDLLVITACNAVSSLSSRLCIKDREIDVKPRNVLKVLQESSSKLIELFEEVRRNSLSHRGEVKKERSEEPRMRRPRASRTTNPAI